MADQDLTILDENKPNGATEEVAVLDEYQRETRTKLKAWAGVEHDPVTGAHIIPSNGAIIPPAGSTNGRLLYAAYQKELLVDSGGAWRSTAQPTYNYAINGMFDKFYVAPVVAFGGWQLYGADAYLYQYQNSSGAYGYNMAHMRAGATQPAVLYQAIANSLDPRSPLPPMAYWRGRTVTFGALVTVGSNSCSYLQLYDGLTYTLSPTVVANGLWNWITITKFIDWAATRLQLEIVSLLPAVNTFISGVTLVDGYSCPHPLPQSWQGRQGVMHFGSSDTMPSGVTWWYSSAGHSTNSLTGNFLPFDAMVSNFYVNVVDPPGAGTIVTQVVCNAVGTPLYISMTGSPVAASIAGPGYYGARGTSWTAAVARSGGATGPFFGAVTFDEILSLP